MGCGPSRSRSMANHAAHVLMEVSVRTQPAGQYLRYFQYGSGINIYSAASRPTGFPPLFVTGAK